MIVLMICIRYNNGRVLLGIVLAFGDRVVRVAVKDSDDAVEFRLVNEVWVSEDCEVVKLDFAETLTPVESEDEDQMESLLRSEAPGVSLQRLM
jgi:hypothetical protein